MKKKIYTTPESSTWMLTEMAHFMQASRGRVTGDSTPGGINTNNPSGGDDAWNDAAGNGSPIWDNQ